MEKLMRYFLQTSNINEIDLYIVDIKVHLHLYLIFYLGHFNILKSVIYMKQLAVS